ncbi:MAG: hypothetical protein IPK83_04570 [Planctomycetes bacterium]|nr:hypothetical protein [Planctomycetota bacterium]
MTSKDIIKLSVAVVALIGAGYFIWANASDSTHDAGDETKTEWYCTGCEKSFVLNGAELANSMRLQEREIAEQKGPSDGPKARGRGDVTTVNIVKCPFCEKWTGEAARTCEDCGEIFLARTKRGETAICPKCKWDPHTGHKVEGDRAETARD